jgi:hypothetical protein
MMSKSLANFKLPSATLRVVSSVYVWLFPVERTIADLCPLPLLEMSFFDPYCVVLEPLVTSSAIAG